MCDVQRLPFNSCLKNELNAKKVAMPSGGARAAQSPSKPQTESASLNRGTARAESRETVAFGTTRLAVAAVGSPFDSLQTSLPGKSC